jgi:hypothetical protein
LLVTDKLRSYASAFRRLRLTCPHDRNHGVRLPAITSVCRTRKARSAIAALGSWPSTLLAETPQPSRRRR